MLIQSDPELRQPFCSAERSQLCNFSRGRHEDKFCDIVLNLDQWFRRRCNLKTFLIYSSGDPFVQLSGTIFCIFGRSHHGE